MEKPDSSPSQATTLGYKKTVREVLNDIREDSSPSQATTLGYKKTVREVLNEIREGEQGRLDSRSNSNDLQTLCSQLSENVSPVSDDLKVGNSSEKQSPTKTRTQWQWEDSQESDCENDSTTNSVQSSASQRSHLSVLRNSSRVRFYDSYSYNDFSCSRFFPYEKPSAKIDENTCSRTRPYCPKTKADVVEEPKKDDEEICCSRVQIYIAKHRRVQPVNGTEDSNSEDRRYQKPGPRCVKEKWKQRQGNSCKVIENTVKIEVTNSQDSTTVDDAFIRRPAESEIKLSEKDRTDLNDCFVSLEKLEDSDDPLVLEWHLKQLCKLNRAAFQKHQLDSQRRTKRLKIDGVAEKGIQENPEMLEEKTDDAMVEAEDQNPKVVLVKLENLGKDYTTCTPTEIMELTRSYIAKYIPEQVKTLCSHVKTEIKLEVDVSAVKQENPFDETVEPSLNVATDPNIVENESVLGCTSKTEVDLQKTNVVEAKEVHQEEIPKVHEEAIPEVHQEEIPEAHGEEIPEPDSTNSVEDVEIIIEQVGEEIDVEKVTNPPKENQDLPVSTCSSPEPGPLFIDEFAEPADTREKKNKSTNDTVEESNGIIFVDNDLNESDIANETAISEVSADPLEVSTKTNEPNYAEYDLLTLSCKRCTRNFPNVVKLKKHVTKCGIPVLKRHNKLKRPNFEVASKCDVCEAVFSDMGELQEHIFTHTEMELKAAYERKKIAKENEEMRKAEEEKNGSKEGEETSHKKSSKSQSEKRKRIEAKKKLKKPSKQGDLAKRSLQDPVEEHQAQESPPEVVEVLEVPANMFAQASAILEACRNNPATICPCHRVDYVDNCIDLQVEIVLYCEFCKVHFRQMECFQIHYRTSPNCRVNRSSQRSIPKLLCDACNFAIGNLPQMKHHLEQHAETHTHQTISFLCMVCRIKFVGIGNLFYTHWHSHNKDAFFIASKHSFSKMSILNPPSTDVGDKQDFMYIAEYICSSCRTPFGSAEDHKNHVCIPGNPQQATSLVQYHAQPQSHPHLEALLQQQLHHQPISTPTTNSNTNIFAPTFNPPQNAASSPSKSLIQICCTLCSHVFTSKSEFDKHSVFARHLPTLELQYILKTLSPNESQYVCTVCHDTTKTQVEMVSHWSTHSPIIAAYSCSICSEMKDTTFTEVSIHCKTFHKSNQVKCSVIYNASKFICIRCNYGFKNMADKQKHDFVHTRMPESLGSPEPNMPSALTQKSPIRRILPKNRPALAANLNLSKASLTVPGTFAQVEIVDVEDVVPQKSPEPQVIYEATVPKEVPVPAAAVANEVPAAASVPETPKSTFTLRVKNLAELQEPNERAAANVATERPVTQVAPVVPPNPDLPSPRDCIIQCDYCQLFETSSWNEMKKHQDLAHGIRSKDMIRINNMETTGKDFIMNRGHAQYNICNLCPPIVYFATKDALMKHHREHHYFGCRVCGITYTNSRDLSLHQCTGRIYAPPQR